MQWIFAMCKYVLLYRCHRNWTLYFWFMYNKSLRVLFKSVFKVFLKYYIIISTSPYESLKKNHNQYVSLLIIDSYPFVVKERYRRFGYLRMYDQIKRVSLKCCYDAGIIVVQNPLQQKIRIQGLNYT